MTTNTTKTSIDLSGFNYAGTKAQNIRRSAELARAEYLGKKLSNFGRRISAMYKSAGELFAFAQRQNQTARL